MKSCCHGNRDYLMNIFTQLFFSGIEVNTFTSDSLHSIKELLFKTQYYKNHIFLAFPAKIPRYHGNQQKF